MQGPFDFNSREIIDSSDTVAKAACAFTSEDASLCDRQVTFCRAYLYDNLSAQLAREHCSLHAGQVALLGEVSCHVEV